METINEITNPTAEHSIFSFEGKIGRGKYFLTMLALNAILTISAAISPIATLIVSPITVWIYLAQSAKRCHDLGHSGWYQIIPFYEFALLFAAGETSLAQ